MLIYCLEFYLLYLLHRQLIYIYFPLSISVRNFINTIRHRQPHQVTHLNQKENYSMPKKWTEKENFSQKTDPVNNRKANKATANNFLFMQVNQIV